MDSTKNAEIKVEFLLIGDVLSGRSTIEGHLLYCCEGIDKRIKEKLEKEHKDLGIQNSLYSYIINETQKRLKELCLGTYLGDLRPQFSSKGCKFIIAHPRDEFLIKDMFSDIDRPDTVVITISADSKNFL